MAMGKVLKIFHKPNSTPCSILVEHKYKEEAVLLESQAVALLMSNETEVIKKSYVRHSEAYGCLGVLQICLSDQSCLYFLGLVTGCTSVGKILGTDIYRVTQTSFIPLQSTTDDDHITEVKKIFNAGTFYFSWSQSGNNLNLTLCEQRKRKSDHVDNRFFWNKQLHLHMKRFGIPCDEWLLQLICGSVEIRTVYIGVNKGQICIISRLSAERAGTRFNVRGCSDEGHVANFVETEQVIYIDNEVASHIQVRGSVPLFWDQPGLQVGSHKVRLTRGDECSAPAFGRHLRQLKHRYGHQVILNLLSASLTGNRGDEAMLSTLFQAHQKSLSEHDDIDHILFDYHALIKSGNSKNIDKLKDKLSPHLKNQGFFFARGQEVYSEQSGTIRTNCLDCLDRTNCVQTLIGLDALMQHLQYLNLLGKSSVVTRLQQMLREMWVNSGNEISKLYAGTGALQGGSKLMDGARSVSRTIQNNLMDVSKQEAIDIILLGSSLNSELADRARILLAPNMLYTEASLLRNMCKAQEEYSTLEKLYIVMGTYNVNGGKHFRSVAYKDQHLSDWLLDAPRLARSETLVHASHNTESPPDIFAIAFEEIVDLNASNIMAASTENARLWGDELLKVMSRDHEYVPLTSVQLVGVALFVYVRPHLAPHIRDVATDTVKTGLGGATGNKGAVAIRMVLYNSSFCFIGSHFAAGQKEVAERNSDYTEITKRICFPMNRGVFSHDYVFWCGDFNYRIDLPRDEVKDLIARKEWSTLLASDQLTVQKTAGNCFNNFIEGDIAFAPTYKYDLFSDDYDTGEKCRCPAWTDRVLLWRRKMAHNADDADWRPGRILHYGCAALKQSDHRPVVCVMEVLVRRVDIDRRLATMKRLVRQAGPPDATVLVSVQPASPPTDMYALTEQSGFMNALLGRLSAFGEVILIRFSADDLLVTFKEGGHALAASEAGSVQVQEHGVALRLLTVDWTNQVEDELRLGEDNTIPLAAGPQASAAPLKRSPVLVRQQSAASIAMFSAAHLWQKETSNVVQGSGVMKPTRPPLPCRPLAGAEALVEEQGDEVVGPQEPPPPRVPPGRPPPPPPTMVSGGAGEEDTSPIGSNESSSGSASEGSDPTPVAPPIPTRNIPVAVRPSPPIPSRTGVPPPIPTRNAPPPIPKRNT